MTMIPRPYRSLIVIAAAALCVVGCSKEATSPTSAAASPSTKNLPAKVCATLRKVAPWLVNPTPELGPSAQNPAIARGRFAANFLPDFTDSTEEMMEMQSRVDDIASKDCPAERGVVLRATGTSSLHEALN
jgi:hypothetical protein